MKHCKFWFWYFVSQTTSPICLKVFKQLLSFLGFLPSDFCCDFELLLQSSALHLQPFRKFCCMLLIRLPVTWHLLWCWKDSCDTACGVPWECLVHEGVLFCFFSTGQDLPISYVDLMLISLRGFQVILLSGNFSSDFQKEAGLINPFVPHQAALLSDFSASSQTAGIFADSRSLWE